MDWLQWSNPVARWWVWLVSISAVNLVAFVVVRRRAARRLRAPSADELRRFHQVVALCGVYTVGCAFRSVLPRADVQRICLWDTWWSNVFVGRSVATVAELSFVLEGALVLFFLATYLESSLGRAVARAIVPLIVIAECFSWYAVLTTHYLEEAEELCDRIAIIDHGRLVACDTKRNLLRQLDNKSVTFILSEPLTDVPEALKRLGATQPSPHEILIAYRPSSNAMREILDVARACNLPIADMRTEEVELEDIFLQLTTRAPGVPAEV